MNFAKEKQSRSGRKEELMGAKQQSLSQEIPELSSPPLGVEQKVFSSPSPESRLKPPRRSGGEPKNLQHKQSERCKKTRGGGGKPGTDPSERGESEEMEGSQKSKSKSDVAFNDNERDNATHQPLPRIKGPPTSPTIPYPPGFSPSESSSPRSKSSSLLQSLQSTSIPPSLLLSPPHAAVSHSACTTEKESLFLPQQRLGRTKVEKEELDNTSSLPGKNLCGECNVKSSLPSSIFIGVIPPPHPKRDSGDEHLSDTVGKGKGETDFLTLQHLPSMHAATTTSHNSNNHSSGVMSVLPEVGSKGSQQQTLFTRDTNKLPVSNNVVSNTTSQYRVGKVQKLISVPQDSKEQNLDLKGSIEGTNASSKSTCPNYNDQPDPTSQTPNKRRRTSTSYIKYQVHAGRDGMLTGSVPQSGGASRDPAFVLIKKTMSAAAAEKTNSRNKHNLKGKGTGEGLQIVKKTPGIQNATRKVLESLRSRGPMTFADISNILPKLSKAKVNMLLDVVRVAGLVREVKGQGSSPPSYHFLGESPASDYINLGSISSDTRARLAEIRSTDSRIAAIREMLARFPEELDHGEVSDLVKALSKSDKSLDEDPLYMLIRNYTP